MQMCKSLSDSQYLGIPKSPPVDFHLARPLCMSFCKMAAYFL